MKTQYYFAKRRWKFAAVIFIGVCSILPAQHSHAQGVGINNSAASANLSSMFDITSGTGANRGLLIPRVTNAQRTGANFNPLPAAAQGLIVYQTDAAGLGEGLYYNTSTTTTPSWVKAGSTGWSLTGNAGTTAGTNYCGTSDGVDFVFGTVGAERMRILGTGNVGYVGIGTTGPLSKLDIVSTGNVWSNNEAQSNGLQVRSGQAAGSDYTLYMGADKTNGLSYIQSVFWGTNIAPLALNARGGNVGIGTATPSDKLTVTGGGIGGNYGLLPNYAGWAAYGTGDGGAAVYNDNGAYKTLMLVGNNSAGGVRQVSVWDYLTINGPIKINDGTQGVGKILTSDAAGQGSWSSPTSILVYGNNMQSVKLPGMVSTNNTAGYTAIPGASITMNTVHNTFYVFASVTARLDQGSGVAAQFGQVIMDVEVVVDGTPVTYAGSVITDYDNFQGVVTTGTVAITGVPVTLAPGSHTIALYWQPIKLWATNPWTLMMNPAAAASDQCILTVFD